MTDVLLEVSYEQASDLIAESEVLGQLDLGSFASHLIRHPTRGTIMVTSAADGKACIAKF